MMDAYRPSKKELEMLMSFVMKFGWDLCILDCEEEDPVGGMVIGTPEFLEEVIGEDNPHFIYYKCHDHLKSETHQ